MNSRFLLRIALLCAIPLAFTACGRAFVQAPPPNHESMASFTCTNSNTLPMLDAIWGGMNLAAAASAISKSEYDFARDYPDIDRNTAIAGSLAFGVLGVLAARTGSRKVKDCRAALDALSQRQSDAADAVSEEQSWRPPMLLPVRSPLKGPPGN